MKVSDLTLEAIRPYITGDGAPVPYLSGPQLIKFFNSFGFSDEYGKEGLPDGLSRNDYAFERLKSLNSSHKLQAVIEALSDSRKVSNSEEIALQISELIKHDNYQYEKDELGIYRVTGGGLADPISIEAHFNDIKSNILQSIEQAEILIWVAMAWFTDKELGNALRNKHKASLNIQVIVNGDETTQKYGLDFSAKGIEYYRQSPGSTWGKKIMHNKFCVIDLKKVIHGSFNWTGNARYNNENITITESRDLAEEYAREFISLKASVNRNADRVREK